MRGILTSWKRLRISKIIAVILPLPLLLMAVILSSVTVFADSGFPYTSIDALENVNIGLESTGCTYVDLRNVDKITGSTTNNGSGENYNLTSVPAGASGFYEGVVNFFVQTVNDEYDFKEWLSYFGFIRYDLGFAWSITNALANATYSDLVIESLYCSSGNDENEYSWTKGTASSNTSRTGTLRVWDYFDPDKTYKFRAREEYIIKFRVYVYLSSNSQVDALSNGKIDLTTVPSTASNTDIVIGQNRAYYAERDKYYLYNINNNIKSQVSAINSAASQAHSDAIATQNAINSAASQAHADAVQAHNDALNTQDILQNDRTSFSSGMDSLKNDIDTEQGLADTAVDNSVHNYNGALSTIDNVDYDNFFAGQSSPATFWRDVGEYVLDPSNLGQFAGGLVIVTVITLFVFMLRL